MLSLAPVAQALTKTSQRHPSWCRATRSFDSGQVLTLVGVVGGRDDFS
jgi:hypothetical protein